MQQLVTSQKMSDQRQTVFKEEVRITGFEFTFIRIYCKFVQAQMGAIFKLLYQYFVV